MPSLGFDLGDNTNTIIIVGIGVLILIALIIIIIIVARKKAPPVMPQNPNYQAGYYQNR